MISFTCEACGHRFELDESLAGKQGHCKHCGREMVVPSPEAPKAAESPYGFRLKPVEPDAVPRPAEVPASAESSPRPSKRSRAEKPAKTDGIPEEFLADRAPIPLDKSFEPAPLAKSENTSPVVMNVKAGWRHSVQAVLKKLAWLEEWVYLISIFFLMISVTGMMFKYRSVAYPAAVVVFAASVILFALGGFEVFVKPFKESPLHGLAFLFLFPPIYMIYYSATRWTAMKRPVKHALGAFLPLIVLVFSFLFIRPIRDYFLSDPLKKKDEHQTSALALSDPHFALVMLPPQARVRPYFRSAH
jgi:hypothetical protein